MTSLCFHDAVIMTLNQRSETIFEFSIFRLCGKPNFISIRVKMPDLRGGTVEDFEGNKRSRHVYNQTFTVE